MFELVGESLATVSLVLVCSTFTFLCLIGIDHIRKREGAWERGVARLSFKEIGSHPWYDSVEDTTFGLVVDYFMIVLLTLVCSTFFIFVL